MGPKLQSTHAQGQHPHTTLPILYSFRRCPYAMRARMALAVSGQACALREVVLRDKPAHMLDISPKGTVPVLQLLNGTVLDESLDIMRWALEQSDPQGWLTPNLNDMLALIATNDTDFKHHLDRYKYTTRYKEGTDAVHHRTEAFVFLQHLEDRLATQPYLFGPSISLADVAIFPFIRQFANAKRAWFDNQNLPKLQPWLAGLIESDLFKSIMTKWPVWKDGDVEPIFPHPA